MKRYKQNWSNARKVMVESTYLQERAELTLIYVLLYYD